MIVFQNKGLIELDAVTTMGVSVKNPGSFGRFGTGIKYGIATVLRGGGTIRLYRGGKMHTISTVPREIRGVMHDIVTLDGQQLGFATTLGRDWQPWMVLREFGCNARDEGGSFSSAHIDFASLTDSTIIVIDWPALDEAYTKVDELFIPGEALWADETIRILPGPSKFVFYRGVRALELPKSSFYSYDVLSDQMLTEDRTLYGVWQIEDMVRDRLLALTDPEMLRPVLDRKGGDFWEYGAKYKAAWAKPSAAFITTALEIKENREGQLVDEARGVLTNHMHEEAVHSSGKYTRSSNSRMEAALEVIGDLGLELPEDLNIVSVPELDAGLKSMIRGKAILILESLERESFVAIAEELMPRIVELTTRSGLAEDSNKLLCPLLLKRHWKVARAIAWAEAEDADRRKYEDKRAQAAAPESTPLDRELDDAEAELAADLQKAGDKHVAQMADLTADETRF